MTRSKGKTKGPSKARKVKSKANPAAVPSKYGEMIGMAVGAAYGSLLGQSIGRAPQAWFKRVGALIEGVQATIPQEALIKLATMLFGGTIEYAPIAAQAAKTAQAPWYMRGIRAGHGLATDGSVHLFADDVRPSETPYPGSRSMISACGAVVRAVVQPYPIGSDCSETCETCLDILKHEELHHADTFGGIAPRSAEPTMPSSKTEH